ncbi:MAG: alcohol dehydrogenase catalytic domain-containing protein [Candidatus Omnitrophica bacterium]|nr:alcohol dehydrogenase catalytic domain-containing protein [Candidatus Omnitrophota bacterium]
MKALVLDGVYNLTECQQPLTLVEKEKPVPGPEEILVRVKACGVCRTELDEIEGRVKVAFYPIVLGHQVVGVIEAKGIHCHQLCIGDWVGIGWFYSSCGTCRFCQQGQQNLCSEFKATGLDVNGGYAEYLVVPETSAYRLPEKLSVVHSAPLLCAGAIGYRCLRLSGLKDGQTLGLIGFGASGHLVLQMAKYLFPHSPIFVFTRSVQERQLAQQLGAAWTGEISAVPPSLLDCGIDTTPVWQPVITGLAILQKGGRLIINAISKEDTDKPELIKLNYQKHLWQEKEIKTVANVTPQDIAGCLSLAEKIPLLPKVQEYSLEEANLALREIKMGQIKGAKVLRLD